MTTTVEEDQVTVFVAVDHCTTECVGLHAAKKATRFEALELLRQGVRDYCSGFRARAAAGIGNRHDHGSQYMSDDYQAEIAFWAWSLPHRSCASQNAIAVSNGSFAR